MVGDIATATKMSCARWRFPAKTAFEGSFENIKTEHPMLIIGYLKTLPCVLAEP